MIRKFLRKYLGVDKLSEQQRDLWWELNDGSGIKNKIKDHERVMSVIIERQQHPEAFETTENGFLWKSPNHKTSKKVWAVGVNKSDSSYYSVMESFSRFDERREENYETR